MQEILNDLICVKYKQEGVKRTSPAAFWEDIR